MCIVVLHSAEWGLLGAVLVVQSDSSRKEGPVLPLLHTLRVNQSVPEGAAQCWDSDLQEVGLLHQQWWQLIHHLHWVKRASQDGAGLLHTFVMSSSICCWDAAAPADYSIENGWCHHRALESRASSADGICLTFHSLWEIFFCIVYSKI